MTAVGQSHPAWWTYVPPEATALVGIQWSYVRHSPFAAAVAEELSPEGSLGFPDLPLLENAEHILISSPATLALVSGPFPRAAVHAAAAERGWKPSAYKGFEIWVTQGRETLSLAQIDDQLLLLGLVPTLREAIDRMLDERGRRRVSPLLGRAARFAKEDLWVVASRLPDPLASLFVPLEAEARSFEGSVSLWEGLHLVAGLEARSIPAAEELAEALWETVAARPALLDGTGITVDGRFLSIKMDLSEADLAASLRAPAFAPAASAPPPPPVAAAMTAPAPVSVPAAPLAAPSKPERPRVVRILGLADGPREIPMKPR
jgi:hypothetical protein